MTPKKITLVTIFLVFAYFIAILVSPSQQIAAPLVLNLVAMLLFLLIFYSSFKFASREVIIASGVSKVQDLSGVKIFSLYLFSLFSGVGFVAFFVVIIDSLLNRGATQTSQTLLFLIIGYLLVFPLFEFYALSNEEDEANLPAEIILEQFISKTARILHSRTLAVVFTYTITYIIPIILLINFLNTTLITAFVLWALILPLVNIGALAGSGLGEDLLKLKLLRNGKKWRDFKSLGFPKISFKTKDNKFSLIPSIEIGEVFIVLFAIQAVITTSYFTITSIQQVLVLLLGFTLLNFATIGVVFILSLLNKGRGAMNEMLAVWNETGFKVTLKPLFLPIFVLLGVILASILEVYVTLSPTLQQSSVLGSFGINRHPKMVLIFLIIQNAILILSILVIWTAPPGAMERRLVTKLPVVYKKDSNGWIDFYNKIESSTAQILFIRAYYRYFLNEPDSSNGFVTIIERGIESTDKTLSLEAAKTLHSLLKSKNHKYIFYQDLVLKALENPKSGVRFYSIKILREEINRGGSETNKEQIIQLLLSKFFDTDSSVNWEATQALRSLLISHPEYSAYVMSFIIRAVLSRNIENKERIYQFFNFTSLDDENTAQLTLSTLTTSLHDEELNERQLEDISESIRQIIRAKPHLSEYLLNTIETEIDRPELKFQLQAIRVYGIIGKNSKYQIDRIQKTLLTKITNENIEVKTESLIALTKTLSINRAIIPQLVQLTLRSKEISNEQYLIAMLNLFSEILNTNSEYTQDLFEFINSELEITSSLDNQTLRNILIQMAKIDPSVAQNIFFISDELVKSENTEKIIIGLEFFRAVVQGNSDLSLATYKKIQRLRNSQDQIIQQRVVNCLTTIAESNNNLAKEIVPILIPLLNDNDWAVRTETYTAVLNYYVSNSFEFKDIKKPLINALSDVDYHVREVGLEFIGTLIDSSYDTANILNIAKKQNKSNSRDIKETGLEILEIAIERDPKVGIEAIDQIFDSLYSEETNLRQISKRILQKIVEYLSSRHHLPGDTPKKLDKLVSTLMRGANNNFVSVRLDSYDSLAIIAENLPKSKVSERIRKTLNTAYQKKEREPSLKEYLKDCILRAKPPVFYKKEGGKVILNQ